MTESVVLDAWAILAMLGGEEPAASDVQHLLELGSAGDRRVIASIMNLGEVYYITARAHGNVRAKEIRHGLMTSPVEVADVHRDQVWRAAELKAQFAMSYADCFAAALAIQETATLMTGDPEFGVLEKAGMLPIKWLTRGSK
jgi:ribonuclease VapC